jgi:HAMP domain-containing protein
MDIAEKLRKYVGVGLGTEAADEIERLRHNLQVTEETEKRYAELAKLRLDEIERLRKERAELLDALDTTVKAIMIFRNEPTLERLHILRSSAGYGVLQQAMDIGRDAINRIKGAE